MKHPTYEGPLSAWIGSMLHKSRLEGAMESIKHGRAFNIDQTQAKQNIAYIEKLLREEAIKQFNERSRPSLEVILNAIDARPQDMTEEYVVDIRAGHTQLSVRDNGRGMSLEDIFRFLIIPFNTEKEGIEEIGRYGVGFLSTFNYCLRNPEKSHVLLDTCDGKESYSLDFFATDDNVGNLQMRVRRNRIARGHGTRVRITNLGIPKSNLNAYISHHTQRIPAYIATIKLNKRHINARTGDKWYSSPVVLEIDGRKYTQDVGVQLQSPQAGEPWTPTIILTAQGVPVRTFSSTDYGTVISFPPAIKLVEGRDEFKIDENYYRCVVGAFKALEQRIRDAPDEDDGFRQKMINFFPSLMSAFAIESIKDVPNLDGIKEALLHGKRYCVTPELHDRFEKFFGPKYAQTTFAANHQSLIYWRDLFGNDAQAIAANTTRGPAMSVLDFYLATRGDDAPYANLHLIATKTATTGGTVQGIQMVTTEPGRDPVMIHDEILYVNASHPLNQGSLDPAKVFLATASYLNLPATKKRLKLEDSRHVEQEIRQTSGFLTDDALYKQVVRDLGGDPDG
ncbi:MAG: ATP-binding protein [Nanoarchaeota archaeon]